MSFHANLYQEIFLLSEGKDSTSFEPFVIYKTIDDLNDDLADYDESRIDDIRVLHGFLTPATVIPKEFEDENPFIIIENPAEVGSALVYESNSDMAKELAEEIEHLIDGSVSTLTAEVSIEEIYILYGYDVSVSTKEYEVEDDERTAMLSGKTLINGEDRTGLTVEEWDLDELRIQRMLKVSSSARGLMQKHFNK
jgi:hypothetical protein